MQFLNEPTQRQKCDAQQHRNNYVLSFAFFTIYFQEVRSQEAEIHVFKLIKLSPAAD